MSIATLTDALQRYLEEQGLADTDLVLTELRGFNTSRGLDEARKSLAHGPRQAGAPRPAETVRFILDSTS
ncbi:hypothetical protein IWX65_000942 [Arthrobacter sp. CAN_A214]|uniref:hypothetical protein n=1 Tax=Arthrobacter sp. CAN_A214 TaxID=2787720 RepID=UPI0018C90681